MHNSHLLWIGSLWFLAALATPGLRAAATLAADPAVVELPVYTVTDSRDLPPPERWSYARLEGFEVLSNASERSTREILEHLRRFSQALDIVWPRAQRVGEMPAALIICGRDGKFDEFVPVGTEARVDRGRISLALRHREQSAIVIDHEARELDLVRPGVTRNVQRVEADAYQQLTREYVHFLFGRAQAPFPPWFVEGMAQILMAMEVSRTLITVGQIEDPIGSTWAKQSAAFVHWGLYGNGGLNQKAFLQFVVRITREPLSEELFTECFKLGYRQMIGELRSYIDFTPYKMMEFRAKKGEKLPDLPPLELRDATQAEIGRIKGETLRLAGHTTKAHAIMIAAHIRGERDPELFAALGLEEIAMGDMARAKKFLEAAVQAKTARARAYVELARMRLEEANTTASAGALTRDQVNRIIAPLLSLHTRPPTSADVYELLARAWLAAAAVPEISQLKIADEGVRRFPRNTNLIHDTAALMLRAGRPADAAMIIQHGLSVARSEDVRTKFLQLQASLPSGPRK